LRWPQCALYYLFVIRSKRVSRQPLPALALTSEVAALRSGAPVASARWESSLRRLIQAAKTPNPAPSWWNDDLGFFGMVETLMPRTDYWWDGMKRLGKSDPPFFFFQFTLAGWGIFELYDEAPRRVTPGMGFLAVVPSRHRYYLPADSPGWTFGWINVFHPYLIERVSKQIASAGPVVDVEPASAFLANALRLVCGSFRKDFRDRFEVELALFEFVIAYERLAHQLSDPSGERDRLLAAVREWVLSNPSRALNVGALAAEYGMSRSHFSRFFRARTGVTPARFVAQTRVREASRMLLDGHASLKEIAYACGFANPDHFNRVFRRLQHISPGAYRRSIP
jgi:AraC-like DNA-binding protein